MIDAKYNPLRNKLLICHYDRFVISLNNSKLHKLVACRSLCYLYCPVFSINNDAFYYNKPFADEKHQEQRAQMSST